MQRVATKHANAPMTTLIDTVMGPVLVSNVMPINPINTPAPFFSVNESLKHIQPIKTPIIGVVALKIAE
ncbi:hypothetical protein PHLH7_23830 [Pseudomonas sp. Ost2]|nr:hypothetical protein PHLH7_23830 [Pseudomonas sp. Ost2]